MAYYIHLLASKKHGTLHLGVTNDIARRGYEHRTKAASFAKRISSLHRGYGFRARAKRRVPE